MEGSHKQSVKACCLLGMVGMSYSMSRRNGNHLKVHMTTCYFYQLRSHFMKTLNIGENLQRSHYLLLFFIWDCRGSSVGKTS